MKSILFILISLLGVAQLVAQENKLVNPAIFPDVVFVMPNPPKPIKGWKLVENWKATDGMTVSEDLKNGSVLVGEYPGKIIKFQFKGNAVGIEIITTSDSGIIEYSVDGSDWQKQDLFTPLSKEEHIPLCITLGKNLKDWKHTLQIRLTGEKNSESTGNKCIIRHFYFNSPK